ncbi:MAG: PEGA domain-containing protein [Bryobacteraceae bacterium]
MDTEVELRILQTVSSAESRVNEKVLFEVVDDVIVDQTIVIPQGSRAWGLVTAVEPKSRMRKNGKIDIDLQAVCLPGGTGAPLRAYRRGAQRVATDQPSVGDSLFAIPALPVIAFLYGKDVAIPKGREFTAFLGETIAMPKPLARPEPAQSCPSPQEEEIQRKAPVIVEPELASLAVHSKPEGAEIWVNGRFMGQTPATLRLPPGEHQVQLRSPDKAAWERTVVATPGGMSTLQAVLESTVLVKR